MLKYTFIGRGVFMNISKAVRTLLATGLIAAGSALAADKASAEEIREPTSEKKMTDLPRPQMNKLADSYLHDGQMPPEILDVGIIHSYGVTGYRFTFVTGQQASLIGETFYVRRQKVPESTLELMRQMRDFRNGRPVEGLRIASRWTKVGDYKFRMITFPNGQRGRLDQDGTVTYPMPKTSVRKKEMDR